MRSKIDVRLTAVLAVLAACTILSWWLGTTVRDRGLVVSSTPITIAVLVIACFKARLIIRQFMEVRTAPRWLRAFTDLWLIAFWGAVLAIYLVATAPSVSTATTAGTPTAASPAMGNGPNGDFWAVPAVPAGAVNGQLLYYDHSFTSQLHNVTAWTVAYVSTDATGRRLVVTGTVAVPAAAWTGRGVRPIIDYAVGTQGMGQSCAPSREWNDGTEYESANINADLAAGYAVIVTDYEWAGTTNTPPTTYVVGLAEGHSVLDILKAALELPGVGLTHASPVIVAGYSQGGGAAVEAGEQWRTYAPSVHLVGVSAGGVPGNLPAVGAALDGHYGAGLLFATILGFHSAYPSLPYTSLLSPAGVSLMTSLSTQCVGTELLDHENQSFSEYTVGGLTAAQATAEGNWLKDLDVNSPGLPGAHLDVPMFNYAGSEDDIIPPAVENATYADLCATGTVVQSSTLPVDHAAGEFDFQSQVLAWEANIFAGGKPTDTCLTNSRSL